MKAICIDNSPGKQGVAQLLLREGREYDVAQARDWPDSYEVEGIKFNPKNGREIVFKKNRFIPLSGIDETERVNQLKITDIDTGG